MLKHTADEWYGKPFLLAPWQEEALIAIFGQVDEAGNRVIEMAYLEVPKKAGKSEWAAGLRFSYWRRLAHPAAKYTAPLRPLGRR